MGGRGSCRASFCSSKSRLGRSLALPLTNDTLSRAVAATKLRRSITKEKTMPGLLTGKKGLVLNIANDRSIAWHIANNCLKQGATCGFGYLPMEKMERRV